MANEVANDPRLWRHVRPGAPRAFETPEQLWNCACSYFEWAVCNPLEEEKIFQHDGEIVYGRMNRMRALTIKGLCVHMGVTQKAWGDWKRAREDLQPTIQMIEDIIYEQKFTGAAANMLNASIIARDLGLAEKSEMSGPNGGPMQVQHSSPRDRLEERLANLASRTAPEADGDEQEDTGPDDYSDLL